MASEEPQVAGESSQLPLGKYLASSDKQVRDKAVDNLRQFLVSKGDELLSEKEMTKLWQGLFFCFWHSDKPLVQQALATDLAELVLKIPFTPAALHFLKGFWTMMMREWNRIDRHRIDKFYMLIRRFVNVAFRLQLREKWNPLCCEVYEFILVGRGGPLEPEDSLKVSSIACHLGDIYLVELEKVMKADEGGTVPVFDAVYPFLNYLSRTRSTTTYTRIAEAMVQPFLEELTNAVFPSTEPRPKRRRLSLDSSTGDSLLFGTLVSKCTLKSRHFELEQDDTPVDAAAVRKAFLKAIFTVASSPDARESNRKKLYALWKSGMAYDSDENETGLEWDGS